MGMSWPHALNYRCVSYRLTLLFGPPKVIMVHLLCCFCVWSYLFFFVLSSSHLPLTQLPPSPIKIVEMCVVSEMRVHE